MSRDEDYRNNALDMLKLAERAGSVGDRLRLVDLAEAWMELAERTEETRRLRKGPAAELHPLVATKLKDPRERA